MPILVGRPQVEVLILQAVSLGRYVSNFAKKFAPYASVVVNGIYWSPDTPRLLTIPDAKVRRPTNFVIVCI